MGIVAHCPNGHRLKLKDQFAGKKVMCPHCQAVFRVAADAAAGEEKGLPIARIVPLDPAIVATLPRALPADAAPAPQRPAPTPQPPAPAPADLPSTPAYHPLIAEQPLATWSVALPGGEASAPLAAAAMQQWLESRQATGGELVWRSDWPAWLPVVEVFPEYVPAAPV